MARFGFARRLTATAAVLAILMAVPAAAAPSFVVYAEEEDESSETTKKTEATKTKETTKVTSKPSETTKATSKPSETTKRTETDKPSETTKQKETQKPSETTKQTESQKPSETTKQTEEAKPSETTNKTESDKPSETTKQEEPSETKPTEESAKPAEPSESTEPAGTTEPTESGAGTDETEPTESTDPTESTEPTESTGIITPEGITDKRPAAKSGAPTGEYKGITIDGNFSDWDPVRKYAFNDPDDNSFVNYGAMVWDGDYIYLYLDEVQDHSSTWSGPQRRGNFSIKTDVGYELMISIENKQNNGNKVSVTNKQNGKTLTSENGGIKVKLNDEYYEWGKPSLMEIRIPTSILPDYVSKISFGYYLGTYYVKNVANYNPVSDPDDPHSHDENDGSKIKIDGDYRDWKNYPHKTIEYDTNGAAHNFADAHGAIYQKNAKTVYVHCYTNNFKPPFDWYDGDQFLEITVYLGGKQTKMVAALLDEKGNVTFFTHNTHYPEGTYKFALFEQSGSHLTKNIKNIDPGDTFYGYQYITVGNPKDETELSIDTEALAKHLGLTLTQAAELRVHFHRVGKEHLIASGISTGPIFTLALTSLACGSYYVFARRKRRQA